VRDEISRYQEFDIRPFGVNPAAVQGHAAYAAKLRLPFSLLSDPDLAITGAFGALRADGHKVARSVCLIDRDGQVLYSQAGAPGADIILEHLSSS